MCAAQRVRAADKADFVRYRSLDGVRHGGLRALQRSVQGPDSFLGFVVDMLQNNFAVPDRKRMRFVALLQSLQEQWDTAVS